MDEVHTYLKSKDYSISIGTCTNSLYAYKHTSMISHSTIVYIKHTLRFKYLSMSNSLRKYENTFYIHDHSELFSRIIEYIEHTDTLDLLDIFNA